MHPLNFAVFSQHIEIAACGREANLEGIAYVFDPDTLPLLNVIVNLRLPLNAGNNHNFLHRFAQKPSTNSMQF
jgi:hypothetical protein